MATTFAHPAFRAMLFALAGTLAACVAPRSLSVADREKSAAFASHEREILPRINDCIRTLPALLPEARPHQIQAACHDKYSLQGAYVNDCYRRATAAAKANRIPPPTTPMQEMEWRRRCSDRADFRDLGFSPNEAPQGSR